MLQTVSRLLPKLPLFLITAVITHLVMSFAQTLMHYKLGHHPMGGRFFRNALGPEKIAGLPSDTPSSIMPKKGKKTGVFFVPGFAKFVVIKKPATKARKGINPFTKEPTIFKAKPSRKVIRARPVKAVKDAVA
jgi:DNA-binding protein HU-beta